MGRSMVGGTSYGTGWRNGPSMVGGASYGTGWRMGRSMVGGTSYGTGCDWVSGGPSDSRGGLWFARRSALRPGRAASTMPGYRDCPRSSADQSA